MKHSILLFLLIFVLLLASCQQQNGVESQSAQSSEPEFSTSEGNHNENISGNQSETSGSGETASSIIDATRDFPPYNAENRRLIPLTIYNWLCTSQYAEHTLPLERFSSDSKVQVDGYIVYHASVDSTAGNGGAGVLDCWDESVLQILNFEKYATPEEWKYGGFQVFGLLNDWVLYDMGGKEIWREEESPYRFDDPRTGTFASDDNTAGAVKTTEKYQRTVCEPDYHLSYVLDIGHGYGITVYFYTSPELTAEELEVYDKIAESVTLVLTD